MRGCGVIGDPLSSNCESGCSITEHMLSQEIHAMSIPDYQSIMLPLLQLPADQNEHKFRDAVEKLAQEFMLTSEEQNELLQADHNQSSITVLAGQEPISSRLAFWNHRNVVFLKFHCKALPYCKPIHQKLIIRHSKRIRHLLSLKVVDVIPLTMNQPQLDTKYFLLKRRKMHWRQHIKSYASTSESAT